MHTCAVAACEKETYGVLAFVFKCSGCESSTYNFLRILPEVAHEKPPFERSVLRDGQGPNRSLKKESVRIFLANLVGLRNCGTVIVGERDLGQSGPLGHCKDPLCSRIH